jgi:hypothetical protein
MFSDPQHSGNQITLKFKTEYDNLKFKIDTFGQGGLRHLMTLNRVPSKTLSNDFKILFEVGTVFF